MALRTWMKNLLIYDSSEMDISNGAAAFSREAPAFNAKEGVEDFSTALDAINKYGHVELLIFETHGSPGYVHFPKGGINDRNAQLFSSVSNALEDDARILFEGCSVGEGTAGRKFLLAVGRHLLLGKGGFVGATTCTNLGSPLEIISLLSAVRMPPWGTLRIMQFDSDGTMVREVEKRGAIFSAP